jgi:excisionase family DNA binding protein
MTPRQAAELIGISTRYLRHLIAAGRIRARRVEIEGGFQYDLTADEVSQFRNTPRSDPRGRKRGPRPKQPTGARR